MACEGRSQTAAGLNEYGGQSEISGFSPLLAAIVPLLSPQKFHHSLKEYHKIRNIPKFRCEML